MVSELLLPSGGWDTEKINAMFSPYDVDNILKILIGAKNNKDTRWDESQKLGSTLLTLRLVNCSVLADLGGKRIGIGIIIRNCEGAVIASCAQNIMGIFDGQVAGIMVVYKGILFSFKCGLRLYVFESNCSSVVDRILSGNFLGANVGHILENISNLEKLNYMMNFKAITKATNHVALHLARIGVDYEEDKFWMENVPDGARNLVDTDMPL
ncbi:hypothetical protein Ddye_008683 [Dipteronia dyeriana]|uniref:RNase H type-1 domain-containing protein n=1 Tax=Dipteronia dyeriana TaxID=168575 RepID=A0AAE0CLL3_9ROSI|nr:hypothetical protein Ddye_008683 [Dipteronia dyeriana]